MLNKPPGGMLETNEAYLVKCRVFTDSDASGFTSWPAVVPLASFSAHRWVLA